ARGGDGRQCGAVDSHRDRGGAEVKRVGICQSDVVSTGDCDGAEVIAGVVQGDVVGGTRGQGGGAGDIQPSALSQGASGRHVQGARDSGGTEIKCIAVH